MTATILAQLAPTGVLRAGINMSNFLLVNSRADDGSPRGVSPSMAAAVAARLGVPVRYVPFPKPGELADAVGTGAWDIGLIGAEPQRAEKIAFTAAYAEIEATYLVPPGSPITSLDQVDRPGIRIAVTARSAYDLWLARNIHHATLVRADSLDGAWTLFREQGLEACAGLLPRLLTDVGTMPCSPTSAPCPARASWKAASRPCSRPSAPRAPMRKPPNGSRISSRKPRPPAWSPASSRNTASAAWP